MWSAAATRVLGTPGHGADFEFAWSTSRVRTTTSRVLPGHQIPVVGPFATVG
jgi:hypothetical protein